jgi:hypothetical protein
LVRFANERGHIGVFDKTTGKVFATGPRALAAENQFYNLPEFTGTKIDPLFLEKQFAQLEGEACNITACWLRQLERLIAVERTFVEQHGSSPRDLKKALEVAPKLEIPDTNREIMSSFIALQFFRTADAREILKLFAEVSGVYKKDVSDDEARSLQATLLCQLADGRGVVFDFARRIRESIWMFACNLSEVPFHTSDTPVLLKTPDNRKWLKGPGIFQPGVYVVFAITPTFILYCKERTWWKTLAPFDNCLSPIVITNVMSQHENSGHAGMSARFVFSPRDDFVDAKAFVADPSNFLSVEELFAEE